ncbi:MAG TPA: hypothetical protein VE377_00540 [Candidatus Dormibacteraeota bacterium]|nr:hypothetical protein [Candidatus Dormibacteraeota bacterium]
MNPTLLKTLFATVPTLPLFLASVIMLVKEKRPWSVLQFVGTTGMMMVLFTHLCEALQLFPWMEWGQGNSVGHYLDLSSAVLGVTFFPLGFLLHALAINRAQ